MSARIEYHMEAFDELRTCKETHDLLRETAENLVAQANALSDTGGAEYTIGKDGIYSTEKPRIRVSVHPGNVKAALDNQRNNTLLKTLGVGKGV